MDTKQPEAIRIAEWLEGIRGNTWPSYIPQEAAAELRRLQSENDTLRAGYDAARLEIESLQAQAQQCGAGAGCCAQAARIEALQAQLEAVGAGGVSALVAAPAQPATAKQSPHPEYDKGFSDGWNRCEERQAAAPAQAARAAQAEPEDLSVAYFMGLHAAKRAPQPAAQEQPVALLVRKKSWLDGQWECAPKGFGNYGMQWADERMWVYAAPQPATAQEARKPLTDEQIDHAIAELGLNYLADAHETNRSVLRKLCHYAHAIAAQQGDKT